MWEYILEDKEAVSMKPMSTNVTCRGVARHSAKSPRGQVDGMDRPQHINQKVNRAIDRAVRSLPNTLKLLENS